MSNDPEIQFGDLEEEQPAVALRPDRNAHYAVMPYGEPAEGELPIFIDLDVLIEMEAHALEDTSVELGGVMLGGQLHDPDGQPYILVQDSLRAEHYEATKGSFKFTHDTWQEITRRRDEFPENWDMVGWYHTHPDWGVFLSGMDMFICDNFFNKPLDVALVIDPCRQDRAFFQWTGDPRDRKRRVGGFHVIASRHRQGELEQFVTELEGGYSMRTDPRLRQQGYQVSTGTGGAPTIVNITEQRPGWLGQAVVATMITQGLLIMLLFVYVMRGPQPAGEVAQGGAMSKQEELKLKTAVVNDLIKSVSGEKDVATRLQEKEAQIANLQNDLAVYSAGMPKLKDDLNEAIEKSNKFESSAKEYQDKYYAADRSAIAWKKKYEAVTETASDATGSDTQPRPWWAPLVTWQGITISAIVLGALALAMTMAMRGSGGEELLDERDRYDDQPPPDGQITSPENQAAEPDPDEPPHQENA